MCDYWEVCSGETGIDDRTRYQVTAPHPELELKHHLPLLTSSSTRAFRACARRYYYAYDRCVRPRAKAGALTFGNMIHAGLEAWMKSACDLDAALAAMRTQTYDYDSAKAEAMLRGYHARWSAEPLEVLAVEQEFVSDLTNPETGSKSRTFMRAGKLDGVVRRQEM